jgi:hypothetical protein
VQKSIDPGPWRPPRWTSSFSAAVATWACLCDSRPFFIDSVGHQIAAARFGHSQTDDTARASE